MILYNYLYTHRKKERDQTWPEDFIVRIHLDDVLELSSWFPKTRWRRFYPDRCICWHLPYSPSHPPNVSSLGFLPQRGRQQWHTIISPETWLPGRPSLPLPRHGHLDSLYLLPSLVTSCFISILLSADYSTEPRNTLAGIRLENANWNLTLLKSQAASDGNSHLMLLQTPALAALSASVSWITGSWATAAPCPSCEDSLEVYEVFL